MNFEQISQFIDFYFIKPIVFYEGYNIINTTAYALLALLALYFIYQIFERKKIKIGEDFYYGVIGFVLFGSVFRVCVDAATSLQSYPYFWEIFSKDKIFNYSLYTVSPTIYISITILFFICYYIEQKIKVRKFSFFVGLFLALICFTFLYFFLKYVWFALVVVGIAFFCSILIKKILKINQKYWLVIFSHALDGAATWIAIDILPIYALVSYQEQHVLPNFISGLIPELGFFSFFVLKLVFATLAVKILQKEEEGNLKEILTLAMIVIGLAPAVRDVLRATAGV
ncbi:MAG: DUF63 family protein [Candidatus Omnitrophica bacterium]|nr:DUF63 family protein [Candidatus Omnitrophota bacterium]